MGDAFFSSLQVESSLVQCRPIITSFSMGTASGICLQNITEVRWNDTASTYRVLPSYGVMHIDKPPGSGDAGIITYTGIGGGGGYYGPEFWATPQSYRAGGTDGYNVYGGPFEWEIGFTFMYIQSGSNVVYQVSASSYNDPKNTSCGSYRAWYQVSGSEFSSYACHGALVTFKTGSVMNVWLDANYLYWAAVNTSGGTLSVPIHPF